MPAAIAILSALGGLLAAATGPRTAITVAGLLILTSPAAATSPAGLQNAIAGARAVPHAGPEVVARCGVPAA